MNLTDHAAFDELFGLGVQDGTDALAADLENAAGLLLGVNDHMAIGHFAHHGLLAVDVFAGVKSIGGDAGMPMIGRRDNDGIHIRPGE